VTIDTTYKSGQLYVQQPKRRQQRSYRS